VLMQIISRFAPHAELHLIRNPKELQPFLAGLEQEGAKSD